MSVFTFISRQPRIVGRPKHIVTPPAQPVKFIYRARRWPIRIRHGSSIRLIWMRRRLRHPQPIVAPAKFVPTRKAWPRVKIKRGRRLVRWAARQFQPQRATSGFVYRARRWPVKIKRGRRLIRWAARQFQPQAAPVGFIYRARHWPIKVKRGRRFTRWAARKFAPQASPVGFIPTKRRWPVKVKRARNWVRWFSIRRFQPQRAPVGFVPIKRRWPVKIKHARRLTRWAARQFQPQQAPSGFVPTKRRWTVKIRHAKTSVLWFAKRRFQPQASPVGFVPQKRMLRPKIRRSRIRVRRQFSLLSIAAVLFRRLPRLKIKHGRSSALWLGRRRLQPQTAPVGFIPQKKMARPKIRRARARLRRLFPFLPSAPLLFRKMPRLRIRRGKSSVLRLAQRRLQPQKAPSGFVPQKRVLRPKIRRARNKLRRNFPFLPAAAILFRKLPRLRIRRARSSVLRLARLRLQPQRSTVGFVPAKRRWPVRVRRARHFTRRIFPIRPQVALLFRKLTRPKIKRAKTITLWFARKRLRLQPQDRSVGFVPTKHKWPQVKIRRARKLVLWLARRRLQPQRSTVGFVPAKRRWPIRIRRARHFTRRIFPIRPQVILLFRKLPRLRIRRARKLVLWVARQRLQPMAPPVGFVPEKHRWPIRIRRARRFARRIYAFAFAAPPLPPFTGLLRFLKMTGLQYQPLGYEQITNLVSAVGLGAIPTEATAAVFSVTGGAVRWRDDGTAPTASVGTPILGGKKFRYGGNLSALKFISASGSPVLDVAFYRGGSPRWLDVILYKDVEM